MFTLFSLLFTFGCGDKSSAEDTGTVDTSDTNTTEEQVDACSPIEGATGIGMTGSVEFTDGTPAQGNVRVQMCNADICYVAKWGDDGFCFPEGTLPPNEPYAFDLVPLGENAATYANPLTILTPAESFALDQPVKIHTFSHVINNTDSVLDVDSELRISLNETYPETTLSAVKINFSTDGLPIEEFDLSTVLGGWYLGPFDTHLETGLSIEFNLPSISAGTSYAVYNANYESKEWTLVSAAIATEDQTITFSNGLQILSTMLLIQQ